MKKLTALGAIAIAVACVGNAFGTTWYVSPSGDGTDPSAGFATGFATIKAAFANGDLADGDTILLDKCTFDMSSAGGRGDISTNSDAINKRVTISGAGTKEETILDGGREWDRRNSGQDKFYPQFYVNANGVTIKNMTLERMGSNGDAAIRVVNGKTDCVVSNIIIRNTGWGYKTFYTANGHIDTGNQNTKVMCSVFTNNYYSGSIAKLTGSNTSVENCYFADNTCVGYKSGSNGVVHVSAGCLRNNTIVNNKSSVGAVYHDDGTVVNNIIYGNTDLTGVGPKDAQQGKGAVANWTYNCLGEGSTVYTGKGNIFKNPFLSDDNMHLSSSSPCICTGSATYAPAIDLEGVERDATKPCMGCCEYLVKAQYTCAIKATPEKVSLPDTVTLSVEISGTPVGTLTYAWDFECDGIIDATTPTAVLDKVGRYNVRVTVRDDGGNGDPVVSSYDKQINVYPVGKNNFTYYVSPSGNGKNPVAGFESGYSTIKKALDDSDLTDGDTILLDRCEFAIKQSEWSGATAGWEIKKAITLTGVGTREETIVSTDTNATKSAEVVGRSAGNRFFSYFALKANGIKFQNMTFERLGTDENQAIKVLDGFSDCVISNVIFRNTGWGYYSDSTKSLVKQPAMIAGGNRNTVISGCVITNNCWAGTFIAFSGVNAVLENCHVADNVYKGAGTSQNLGLLYFNGNYTKIRNNTFINNRTSGGVINNSNSNSDIANNIIRGNTLLDGTTMKNFWNIGTLSKYVYNCLESDGSTVTGVGNIFADPLFKDDNYNLRSASPCKGAGSKAYAPAIDIDGTTRLDPPTIGCKEIIAVEPTFTVEIKSSAESVFEPATIKFSAVVTGTYEGGLSYAWDFNGDGTIDSTEASPVVKAVDSYTPTVVVSDESGAEKSATSTSTVIVYPANKTFYATPANINARPPYATWATAGKITDVHALAAKIADSKLVLDDGAHAVSTKLLITNALTITSLNGRGKTTINSGMYGDVPMFEVNNPNATIENLTIKGRSDKASWCEGSCVYLKSGILRDCVVTGWRKSNAKGIVSTSGCTAARPSRIERCVIANCTGTGNGAMPGIFIGGAGATIENCLVTNIVMTYTGSGWGLGGAFNCYSDQAIIRNCTFANNDCLSCYPLHFIQTPAVFENNIVYGNTTNGTFTANDLVQKDVNNKDKGVVSTVAYTCVTDGERDYSQNVGVITANPGFVDAANGDYHLRRDADFRSSCIGKGVNNGVYDNASIDLDGNKRLKGAGRKVDMGCYENQTEYGTQMILR